MAKRHIPRRYRKKEGPVPAFALSGNVFLKHEDDEHIEAARQGDIYFYLHLERADRGAWLDDYNTSGHAGYLKMMVHDKKGWKPLLADSFFPYRENHFTKKERPRDTFLLCRDIMKRNAGTVLNKTYREHYEQFIDTEVREE